MFVRTHHVAKLRRTTDVPGDNMLDSRLGKCIGVAEPTAKGWYIISLSAVLL